MKTNHYLTFTAVIVAGLASCTSEDLVSEIAQTGKTNEQTVMSFDVHTKNQTRAYAGVLQNSYKDFGVWAYKTIGSEYQEVMPNYLVGYYDIKNSGGYYGNATPTIGSTDTNGDNYADNGNYNDGVSLWFYAGLGSSEYNSSSSIASTFVQKSNSVNETQTIQNWDYNSESTDFFAYAPYGNGDLYSFNAENKEISTTDWVWAGFSNQSYQEKLLAYKNVDKVNYGKDVQLQFKRINAAVQLAFYAPIPGFDTQITSVSVECAHQETTGDVTTIAIDKDNDKVAYGTKVKMGTDGVITVEESNLYHIATSETEPDGTPNTFGVPEGTSVDNNNHGGNTVDHIISKVNNPLSYSPNTFFAMPANTANDKKNSGFKVTVGFKLYSQDTNETQEMVGYVFVPDTYTQWKSNYKYVYIFKLTHETPIVFDGVTVSEYYEETNAAEFTVYPTIINTSFPSELTVYNSAATTGDEGYTTFEFSVNAKQLPSENVKAVIDVSGSTDNNNSPANIIQSLQYYETDQNKTIGWKDLTATDKKYTFDAGGSGFPLQNNVPLKLRIRVNSAGTINAKIQIVGFTSGTVYGETTVSATASDSTNN